MADLAFLGLGTMGFPMAGHLVIAGHTVTVWNRTTSVAQKWKNTHAGTVVTEPSEAVANAQIVFTCLGDDPDVREVAEPLFAKMQTGVIFVDHTTTSAALARVMGEKATKHGVSFIDAPVSGGQAGAESGKLSIMCGANTQAFQTALPIMNCYAKAVKHMGDIGSGQLTKMANQICIAGVVQGLSEALHFAEAAGLDPVKVVEAISQGAAQSWQMDNRHKTMAKGKFDFGFAVDWMRKDLRVTLEEAKENGAKLPVTKIVDSYYCKIQEMGGGRWDTSSLIQLLRKKQP